VPFVPVAGSSSEWGGAAPGSPRRYSTNKERENAPGLTSIEQPVADYYLTNEPDHRRHEVETFRETVHVRRLDGHEQKNMNL
jgi:hypothetical protein